MRELQPEYESRINFTIIPAEETLKRSDEIKRFGFQELLHGMVAFDTDGQAVVKMPGHNFGKLEIEAAVQEVLQADS